MFFELLVEHNSQSLIESYLIEFIPQYIDFLKGYSPFGVTPSFTQNIIEVNKKLIDLNELTEFKEQLSHLNDRMKFKLNSLIKILEGGEIPQEDPRVLFPVIEESEDIEQSVALGAIDSITIKIGKAKGQNKFIVVPSESERDKELEKQIIISWQNAAVYCKKYIRKLSEHHEVIVSFDDHLGIYKGESVGTALTIGFIAELLKYYNSQTVLNPIEGVAFTGGIGESGKVHRVSKEIVEKKVEISFYSNCKVLAVPKEDETFALYKLDELTEQYPKRDLKIVGVTDMSEILLRRDLVDIKKQKFVVRTGKFVVKNWAGVVFAVILTMLLTYFFALDFDDNPAILENNGTTLYVKNKNGKLLWSRQKLIGDRMNSESYLKSVQKIIDVNNDGINEVLLAGEPLESLTKKEEIGRIVCTDFKGEKIWDYNFKDTVSTKTEVLPTIYNNWMIDTLSINNQKLLFVIANNQQSFSSAIFCLELKTGKRINGTLWNAGFIMKGIIIDLEDDGRKGIVAIGHNNGYESPILFAVDVENINGFNPATVNYKLIGKQNSELISYILIPKTDFTNYYNESRVGTLADVLQFRNDLQKILFATIEGNSSSERGEVWYYLDKNLRDFDIVIGENLRIKRDSLVGRGKLSYPLTDTKEYRDSLKSQMLYWKNGRWVKREELD